MTPGLSENLQEVNDARKTAVINNELFRLQMDIVALQETRLPATGSIRKKEFTFFWQGKPPKEVREHGVYFAIRNRLLGSIVPPTEGSAGIIKLQLHTAAGMASLINAYAPTMTSSTEAKDEFYDNLGLALRDIPQQEPVYLQGNFISRIGSDHSSWHSCLGQFGFGKMNESGQRLLEFCCRHNLCVTNSFFDTKPQHKLLRRQYVYKIFVHVAFEQRRIHREDTATVYYRYVDDILGFMEESDGHLLNLFS
ncbi:craniofacial development protein 2-like [Procambarus clarkii]|uniref:craniofacial development protein 2-like n=1 Tax=Procambarus clarkii TaxID=6728 RepID=UPI003744A516